MSPDRIKDDIVEIGRRLYDRGLIGACEGNISVRLGDELFITPSGVPKGFLRPDVIVRTDLAGHPLDSRRASSEMPMHVAVYQRRPDVRAIVHAHPPTATAFAVAGIPLDRPILAESVVVLGPVPLVPYCTPSTRALADQAAAAIVDSDALLLAHHGALAVGEDVFQAWERMETLEHLARVTLTARLLGRDNPLPAEAVEGLLRLRPRSARQPT